MIPKIIHYCWFGGKPKPQKVLECIETWKKYLPDYKIMEWNESNFDYNKLRYTREAYKVKKFAFVSDVARLYALYNHGGIYLDTDILVVKSFDDLLDDVSFIGYEADMLPGTGVIAAEKKSEWIKGFLNLYEHISFISLKGRLDLTPNTVRLKKSGFLQGCKYDNKEAVLDNGVHVYPFDYLCAKDFLENKILKTQRTYCIHDYQSSWMGHKQFSVKDRFCNILNKFRAFI